jgi:VanZ family protein
VTRGAPRAAPWVRAVLWAAVGAYLALIFYLSSLPDPLPALTERVWDKALHFVEYGGLAALVAAALLASGAAARRAALLAVALASAYGATDEVHQAFVPNRSSDVRDWVADTVGAALGAAAAAVARSAALRVRGARASIPRGSPPEVP